MVPGPGDSYLLSFAQSYSVSSISVNLQSMNDPLDDDALHHGKKDSQSPDTVSKQRSGYLMERVYLLDDDPDVLKVVEPMLRISGYGVLTFRCPAEFLAATEQLPAGVVITDQVMQGIGNCRLARIISKSFLLPHILRRVWLLKR